jgi:nucleotide-binding universal stress UspA family protein
MNILVAVDGSEESTAALERALDVADAMDGSVTVAYAVDPSVYDLGVPSPSPASPTPTGD